MLKVGNSLKKLFKLIFICSILFFQIRCNQEIREYVQSKQSPLKIYLAQTYVDIPIYFLRSISSSEEEDSQKRKELIKQISKQHADWFKLRLEKYLKEQGYEIVPKENADLILESSILDMGEVRPRKFFEGLSVGLVLGAIIGEATGDPQVGLAVFVWEVIEEIIIVYVLKTFLMITTIDLIFRQPDGKILAHKEFTSYSNRAYEKTVPENLRSLRETRVQGSLEQNIKDIVEFISDASKKLDK